MLQDLGERIRLRREKLGLKQQDVANALDISPQAVSKWERGENGPDITALRPLARLLDVTVDWLLAGHDEGRDTFEAAVFVSAIKGAHRRALEMSPRDFALWANGVFYQLTEMTLAHEGVPVKYVGDGYLCFFSGTNCCGRAAATAFQARSVIAEDLRIGLSHGNIFLGAVGHPDYARPDIMGEVVNIAFLIQQWADRHVESGVAATREFAVRAGTENGPAGEVTIGRQEEVDFKGVKKPVGVCEVQLK
jgi:transcriptional regulator with XRE-family HTH domain